MKKPFLLALLLCISFSIAMAQTTAIKGSVVDTTTQENLTHATVCLLQAKDSFLYKFARVQADGSFAINNVDTGKYILMVSYPQYADFVEELPIDGKANNVAVGKINMIQTAHLLQDVIVTQKIAAIRIKGDTTEFNADSFKVQPNASVEDLLKQLPGIQVDKDGKITAQGQTVKKVLVDGEEFFGDDPTLVTKNLRADMVDKVQLYDKSSDQAAFTGIDDGDKQKTINIKLKADKKNGYFGKASGGLGTDKYYQAQGMFNYFKGKRKFAAYGTFGNTGTIGLGFEDEMKYAGSSNTTISVGDGGGVSIMISGNGNDPLSSWNGNYNGQGIPDAKTGGVHFDNKWDNDNQSVNLNYKIGGLSVLGNTSNITQNNLDNGVLYTNSASNFSNHLFRQKADGSYQFQIDSSSSVKVVLGGSLAHTNSDNYYTNNSNRTLDTLVNSGTRATTSAGDNKNFSGNILWQKKFKKKGRTLSWNVNEYATNSNSDGYLNSETDFYKNNLVDSTALVNQRKINDSRTNDFSSNITYTEPLNKNLNLLLSYAFDKNNSNSNLESYNKGADGMYSQLDSIYSNHYLYDQTSNGGGVQVNFNNKKKINFNIGTRINSTNYQQSNLFTDQSVSRNFVNWNPNANFRFKIKDQENLNLNYYGSTQQPSISQLQPVLVNNDPLNIYVGNPDLKPAFNNRFSVNFYNYKVLTQKSFFLYGSYSFTSSPIVTNVTTDTLGVNTYNYFNLKTATSNYYLSADYDGKIKPWDLQYGLGANLNGNKYVNFTNSIMNVTKSNTYSISARLAKYKEKKYDISLRGTVGYNTNNTTLQNQINNNAWNYSISPDIDIFLPAKFQLHTDGDYSWQQATQSFTARSQFIWNAWIGKKFFKKENLLLKASVNDILNQNNGFDRSANNNTISQSYYTTIRRYFMLSLVWNFSKMGPGEKK